MILTGPEIEKQLKAKKIHITPFNKKRINPQSYDLSLGDEVSVYTDWVECFEANHREVVRAKVLGTNPLVSGLVEDGRNFVVKPDAIMDSKKEPEIQKFKMDPNLGWVLKPGIGYLMHTAERINSNSFVPILDGKSSIGRLFISVHETAAYGDIGFDGQFTLEVTVKHAIRIYPGMRVCQVRFEVPQGEILSYAKTGNYRGKLATGPVPSRAWVSAFA